MSKEVGSDSLILGGRGARSGGLWERQGTTDVGKSRQTLPVMGPEFARCLLSQYHLMTRASVSMLTDGIGGIGDLRERIRGSTLTDGASGVIEII